MKLVIERDAFIKSLAKMQGIVEKRTAMPILSNVLLRASQSMLELIATDLEVTVMDKCPVDLHTEGSLTLNARKLYDIVRELPEGPVTLTSTPEFVVKVESGKVRFELMGMSADEFPKIPEMAGFHFNELPSAVLLEMIEKTIYATAGEEGRFSLNGIYTEKMEGDKGLRMIATDGHRLAVVERPVKVELEKGVILPRKGMAEAMKVISATASEKVGLAIKEKMAAVSTNDTVVLMKLVEGKFPDYRKVLPEKPDKKAILSSEELVRNLRRVSIMVDEKARAVKFFFEKGLLKLESRNPNFGSSYSEMEVEYDGKEIKVGFNDRFLLDIVNAAKGEKLLLSIQNENSPVLITVPHDPQYTCIIMPIHF